MTHKCIIATLKGPFISAGGNAVGDDRPTETQLTASMILGVAASCMGIKDFEHDKITAWYTGFSIITASATEYISVNQTADSKKYPQLCSDFQTVQGSLSMNDEIRKDTIISQRGYLTDFISVAALIPRHDDAKQWLEQLLFAFMQPAFIPYLGRRSNPFSAPLISSEEGITEYGSVTQLVEIMFSKLQEQRIGHLRPSSCCLRIPVECYEQKLALSDHWFASEPTMTNDQRVGALRIFEQRIVYDYYRDMPEVKPCQTK
jgi:hypothetical protein